MFTDTHCHIYKEYYENIDEILKRALESNINRVINNGCNRESNKEVLALANTYNNMYIALGIHTESADTYQKED